VSLTLLQNRHSGYVIYLHQSSVSRAEPHGYLDWHEWAERKSRTHTQHRCPKSGLWTIWKPKKQAAPKQDGEDAQATKGTGI